jgi:hypothetical protein
MLKGGSAAGADAASWRVVDVRPLVEWLVGGGLDSDDGASGGDSEERGAARFGASVVLVSDRTVEGKQLAVGLQGVAAMLRYPFTPPGDSGETPQPHDVASGSDNDDGFGNERVVDAEFDDFM